MSVLINKIINRRYTIAFVLILSFPILMRFFGMGETRIEREDVGKVSELFLEKTLFNNLKEYEKHFDKNFPFRKNLLITRNTIYTRYIGISPVKKVLLGKKNWLFITKRIRSRSGHIYSRSIDKFEPWELEYWFTKFNKIHKFLKERGIHLLIVLVPRKGTIYPEYLPDNIRKVTDSIRVQQFTSYCKNNSNLQVLNLEDVLMTHKHKRLVFCRTDSHWNHYGSWLAYREIVRSLSLENADVKPVEFEDFPMRKVRGVRRGDLASMLMVKDLSYKEIFYRVLNQKGAKITHSEIRGKSDKYIEAFRFINKKGVFPKSIVIHDSFGLRLKRYFSSSFSEILFVYNRGLNFPHELIEKEKPLIVIYEMVEDGFYNPMQSVVEKM